MLKENISNLKLNAVFLLLVLIVSSSLFSEVEDSEWFDLFMEVPEISSVGLFDANIKKAPGYATVIELDKYSSSCRSVKDYIDVFAPGIVLGNLEEAGPVLSTRGIMVDSNAKTLFMLDGMHLNHRNHFGYTNEMASTLTGDIKYLEIINGPGAIANGSGAISGFVNLIPKNGADAEGLAVSAEYGFVEDFTSLEIEYGIIYGEDKDLFLYVGSARSGGEGISDEPWDPYNLGNSLHGADDDSNSWPFPDIIMYHLNEGEINAREIEESSKVSCYWNHGNFSLNSFYQKDINVNAGYVYGYRHLDGGDRRIGQNKWYTGSLGFNPKYTFDLTETESIDLKGSLLFLDQGREKDILNGGSNQKYMDSETHMELKLIAKTLRFEKNQIALGSSYGSKKFSLNDAHFMGDGVGGTGEAAETDWKELSFFAEDVVSLSDLLTASFGIRYDEINFSEVSSQNNYQLEDADNTSVRIAAAYAISDTMNIKLSYQQGFRFIDTAYMNWYIYFNNVLDSLGYETIPGFKPEKMDSFELNLSKDFTDLKLKVDLNIYYNSFEDMLGWFSYSTDVYGASSPAAVAAVIDQEGWMGSHTNILGDFKTIGADIIVKFVPTENSLVSFIYGYSKPYSVSDEALSSTSLFTYDKDEFTRYPAHLFKIHYQHSLMENSLKISLAGIYQSELDYKDANFDLGSVYGDPRIRLNGSIEYMINDVCSVKLSAENILENEVPSYAFQSVYGGNVGEELSYWYLTFKYHM